MAQQPGDISTVYDFLVALRDDGEFRALYAADPDQIIDATNIENTTHKDALKSGMSEAINQALVDEGKASEMVARVERYIHVDDPTG